VNTAQFRYSEANDEAALLRIIEGSWMAERDFEIGTTYRTSSLYSAIEEDRDTPVRFLVLDDPSSGIQAMASLAEWDPTAARKMGLTLRTPGYNVGYLGDLRIHAKAARELRVAWRRSYCKLVLDLKNTVLLTSVLDENTLARRALCSGRAGVKYTPVLSYTTLTLFHPEASSLNRCDGEGLEAADIIHRCDLNRRWKVKGPSETREFEPILVTGIAELSVLEGPEFEIALERSVRRLWSSKCRAADRAIQIAAPATHASSLKNAFAMWNHVVTPATLYQVTHEATAQAFDWEKSDRKILDISVL
jgi:hypothetical protein